MGTKYFTILTRIGEIKLAQAISTGKPLEVAQMGVGDGGGVLQAPDPLQTTLVNEKRRAAINSLSVDADNPGQIIAEQVIPENEGGFWLREVGLYDAAGNLIAVANCPETYKPELKEGSGRIQTVRMILIVGRTDAVTLKFDPTVALATRRYADTLLSGHLAETNPHSQYLLISEFVGIPQPWPQTTAPAGWLKCNGQVFDKTRYPRLAQVYPSGVLPDLRGEFIRGWDDGRGVDGDRALLSWQKGTLTISDPNLISVNMGTLIHANNDSANTHKDMGFDIVSKDNYAMLRAAISAGLEAEALDSNGWQSGYGATRPRNIAFNYIVRAA
ncbi:phage tail protein [Dickeya chrysanthemi]|uniref:phage tail-collar fiber domain-containing protein n=1 Tax=Dickeya chrysanthemi TaxID=556 RepID=UPI00301A60DA